MTRIGILVCLAAATLALSCSRDAPDMANAATVDTVVARWDTAERAPIWTEAALSALDTHGAPLVKTVPDDIDRYCPEYPDLDERARKAFWVNLIASLSWHESNWRPAVSGGEGRWHGLLQISPATAQGYGCVADTAADLKVGAMNVSCGIRIMAETVTRDGVISRDRGGIAADWGPFVQERKRADIQSYLQELPYCR